MFIKFGALYSIKKNVPIINRNIDHLAKAILKPAVK
jgi:hypothetical protein